MVWPATVSVEPARSSALIALSTSMRTSTALTVYAVWPAVWPLVRATITSPGWTSAIEPLLPLTVTGPLMVIAAPPTVSAPALPDTTPVTDAAAAGVLSELPPPPQAASSIVAASATVGACHVFRFIVVLRIRGMGDGLAASGTAPCCGLSVQ